MTLSLDRLAENIPLTDREVELAKERMKANGTDVATEVNRLLDERGGLLARSQRDYLTLDEYQAGKKTPEPEQVVPQPPIGAHLPGEPASGVVAVTYTPAEVDALVETAVAEAREQWEADADKDKAKPPAKEPKEPTP